MLYWSQIPFVRICIPFISGIIIEKYLGLEFNVIWIAFLILLLLIHYFFLSKNYKLRNYFGVILIITCFLSGSNLHKSYNARSETNIIQPNSVTNWQGVVIEKTPTNGKSIKLLCKVKNEFDSVEYAKNFKVVAYMPDSMNITIGDVFLAQSYFNEIPSNSIPNIFDYSEFLANRRIHYQTYIKDYRLIRREKSLSGIASKLRNSIIEIYKTARFTEQQLGVLVALTLGNKSYLDHDTRNSFAKAGAMHILAVSGLHVGIVFLIFNSLLSLISKDKIYNYFKAIILLLIVWGFALLTGFSPSVQRAACMFSIIIIATAINRSTNILNSIFGSAFLILLINPNSIFEVGFQLSYSAVLGIVLIYPAVYPIVATRNKYLNWWIGIMVVSFAAQLSTLPLTLYYFHQFPNWFLLVNLIVIPTAFVLVGGSFLLCLIYFLFKSFYWLDSILKFFLDILLSAVTRIDDLPFSYTADIWIDLITAIFISLLVVFLIVWFNNQKAKWLLFGMVCSISICIIEIKEGFIQANQSFIAIYPSQSNQQYIAKIEKDRGTVFIIGDSISNFEQNQIEQHLKSIGVKNIKIDSEPTGFESVKILNNNTILFNHDKKLIAFTNQTSSLNLLQKIPKLDMIYATTSSVLFNEFEKSNPNIKLVFTGGHILNKDLKITDSYSDSTIVLDRKFYALK